MRRSDSEFPRPIVDTEAEGLPDVADDDSTARDDIVTGRWADGVDPTESLPNERPEALSLFGSTAEEQRQGESLDYKLAREQRDVPVDDGWASPVDSRLADEANSEAAAQQAQLDDDVMNDGPVSDPRSPVSLYDHGMLGDGEVRPIGRLVEPDEGARADDEPDAVATDAGAAGGGASAEELAMHETEPPPLH